MPLTHKQRMRDKKGFKSALKRRGVCLTCAPLLGRTVSDSYKGVATQPCPTCERELHLDVEDDSPERRETLLIFARCVAFAKKIPASLFTVKLDEQVLVESPPCGCTDAESCQHHRMVVKLKTYPIEG